MSVGLIFAGELLAGQHSVDQLSTLANDYKPNWELYQQNCGRDDCLVANESGALRFDDNVLTTEQTIKLRRKALVGVSDLLDNGLVRPASLMDLFVRYHNMNGFTDAKSSMNPITGQLDQTNYKPVLTPLPILFKDWFIPFRQDGFSYKNNDGASEANRKVMELLEEMLFNGLDNISIDVGGSAAKLYGYTNSPNTITSTISDWTDTANLKKVVPDTVNLLKEMEEQASISLMNKNVMMYVSSDLSVDPMVNDYNPDYPSNVVIERLRQIPQIMDVKSSPNVPAGSVVLVEMDERTIEMGVAQDVVNVPWTRTQPMENQRFTTFAAMCPIIKKPREGKTGVLFATIA